MKKLNTAIFVLALMAQSLLPVQARGNSDTKVIDELASDEIIIKYKKLAFAPNDDEDLFLEDFANSTKLNDTKTKNKFSRKLARHKKRAISSSSKLALLKIKKKLKKESMRALVKELNSKKFKNSNYQIEAIYPNTIYEISEQFAGITSDPLNYQQLSFRQIQPEKLWRHTKGKGAIVAVIDTGVDYNHEDLKDNIWNNSDEIANNGIDDDRNGYVDDVRGWDFVDNADFRCISFEDCSQEDNDPFDKNSHGTHVAGIIAADANNNLGVSGIAPEATIMPLRAAYSIGSSAYLKTSDIIEAVTYAIDNDANVINMSFAGAGLDVLNDILLLADNLGIVLVAAAGNNSSSAPIYPAALPQVIAVGSIADNNMKSSFSNYGPWVDIVAPGSWIVSTIPGNQYSTKSGTSMSAPHVAAIAALVVAKNKVRKLSTSAIKDLIYSAKYPTSFYVYPGSEEKVGGLSAAISFGLSVDELKIPGKVLIGEPVTMSGTGSDDDAEIVAYEWESDLDGYLGANESITVPSLRAGAHSISFRVQNNQGEWSEPAYSVLNISETRDTNTFNLADSIKYQIGKSRDYLVAKTGIKNRKLIQAYKWVSSESGTIGTQRLLPKNSLGAGYHKVSLLIQDKEGNWSKPLERVVQI